MATSNDRSNKENIPLPLSNEEARLRDLQMERRKLAGTKKPGLFTRKKTTSPVAPPEQDNLQEFMSANLIYADSLKQWIAELEQMVSSLLSKNECLKAQNQQLTDENKLLRDLLEEREHEIEVRKSQPTSTITSSLFYQLQQSSEVPTATEAEPFEKEGLEPGIYMKCQQDNNVNFRAFYLSMLQYTEGRQQLRSLMQQLQLDDQYQLLPLMNQNDFWVKITQSFLTILDGDALVILQDFLAYIDSYKLLDLILVSALRSRVSFLTDHNFQAVLENQQLYTALANFFGINFVQQKTPNYQIYFFQCQEHDFEIVLTDRNEYLVRFVESSEDVEQLDVQSNRFIQPEPEPEHLVTELSQMTPNNDSCVYSAFRQSSGMQGARRLNFDDGSVVREFETDYSPNLD